LSREPLKEGWPEGYVLEAALDLPAGQLFMGTSGLMEQLLPTPFWNSSNRAAQNALLTGEGTVHLGDLNLKEFKLTIPEDLAGHSLTFRARYQGEGLSLVSKPLGPVTIISPCDQSDTARVVASQIYAAVKMLRYSQAVALADSMLAHGLTDAQGWTWAETAARGAARFDKAIMYLDRLYEDFGVISAVFPEEPVRLNRGGPRDPAEQAAYEQKRNNLLQAKTEQEQQQQPQR
jgi:hypothetical protein